jgi:hypothetical protein
MQLNVLMNSNERDFDWGKIITKPVYTVDDKHVGHVDGLENEQFILKDRIIDARYYKKSIKTEK